MMLFKMLPMTISPHTDIQFIWLFGSNARQLIITLVLIAHIRFFHSNQSSFDYIVAKDFILYECADLDIGKDTNLPIDVLIPPVQCHEFIKVYCTSLLTWGNLFAKYYLSEYFRAFYKGKIILLTFPHSPSTDLAEFD